MNLLTKVFGILSASVVNTSIKFSRETALCLAGGTLCHMCYAYETYDSDEIVVDSKYQIYSGPVTFFALNLSDGRQMIIPHSLWYWQFDVTEKWNSLEIGKSYKVAKYGIRYPCFGMYPNIIDIRQPEDKISRVH
jgi:hypothetical protein